MRTNLKRLQQNQDARRDAFTFPELLVLIGMIALLAILLMPALAGNRTDSSAFRCMNNLRQMQVAWTAYSTDNGGKICPTASTFANPAAPQWCPGRMDVAPEDVNASLIQQGLLWPYVKALSAYKCPADPKLSQVAARPPTLRSISCNAWMNPATSPSSVGLSAPGRVLRKQSDISGAFSPSQCWVFADESPTSINDGWFVVSVNAITGPYNNAWIDLPATYHDNACGISFADGHAEIKRWRDKNVTGGLLFTPADSSQTPPYADLRWLQSRTTVPE